VIVSDAGEAAYKLRGVRDARGRPSLRLEVRATLQLRCQRCLGPLQHDVDTDELLVLAASQAEIDAEPGGVDAPDRVVAGHEMKLAELVEDELILAVPYAPRHEHCEARVGTFGEGKTVSPFAGLRGMMRGRH
jgi:uncharacterized protein